MHLIQGIIDILDNCLDSNNANGWTDLQAVRLTNIMQFALMTIKSFGESRATTAYQFLMFLCRLILKVLRIVTIFSKTQSDMDFIWLRAQKPRYRLDKT